MKRRMRTRKIYKTELNYYFFKMSYRKISDLSLKLKVTEVK